jgi:hypothetical protein
MARKTEEWNYPAGRMLMGCSEPLRPNPHNPNEKAIVSAAFPFDANRGGAV